jgi:four helix bundle protein
MDIAMGSATELEYQGLFAHDLKIVMDEEFEAVQKLIIEVKKMECTYLMRLVK